MNFDAVALDRDLRRRSGKQSFDWLKWLALIVIVGFSMYMFLWEFAREQSDLYKHAVIASEFNFLDLHSITSRLAYPLWHIAVAALYQVGIPLGWAAAVVCGVCKALLYLLTRRYLLVMTHQRVSSALITLCAFFLMLVTSVRVPSINDWVYRGVGSPTVWHNPTQLAVLATALLCVPYTLHCWYTFEEKQKTQGSKAMLPWRQVIILAILLMLNLSSKPTFMQAMIPAAAIFFLVEWIRHPKNSRFFMQMILAFLPAAAYFLLQYLYYTGVVVPFTSGVEIGVTVQDAWIAVRNMLLMAAFPLFALICCYRPGMFKDRTLVLCVLMVAISVLEAMFFRETGVRENHGNFQWASMSSAFMLWVVMLPKFLEAIGLYWEDRLRLQEDSKLGTVSSQVLAQTRTKLHVRSLLFLGGFILLMWHVYSSFYYISHLLRTGNVF